VRTEVAAGRWVVAGRHTVVIGSSAPCGDGRWWHAVWESGCGAILDGASALVATGLTGYDPEVIDVSVPFGVHPRQVQGVRARARRRMPDQAPAGVPRARPEWATIRAAQLAGTDRAAALVLCLAVQQGLVSTPRLLSTWQSLDRSPRRRVLDHLIRDVCDGAHSLGELDFAGLCRRYGLPRPSRQVVHALASGRAYLDVVWEDVGLVVEIDGGQHSRALHPVEDSLRQNDVTLGRQLVVRVPVLGLRLLPDAFMAQVVRAYRLAERRAGGEGLLCGSERAS
jgi:hypothetical protein